ncbi:hypothetical protein IZY60_05345 [Lutibacter sp. B2]|nr:hypothetical protein [Lutibacter sp. B2]
MANPEQTLQQASVGSKTRSAIYALKKLRLFVEVFFDEKYVKINGHKKLNDEKKGYMTKKTTYPREIHKFSTHEK